MRWEPGETYLSVKQVARRYGNTASTIWRWVERNPAFPEPVKLSPGCTRWRLSELLHYEQTLGGDN